jgi:hypothetical protein
VLTLQRPFDWHPGMTNGFSFIKKRTSSSPPGQLLEEKIRFRKFQSYHNFFLTCNE